MNQTSLEITDILDSLRPFMEKIATVGRPTRKLFSCCLRSSVTKAYKFLEVASNIDRKNAFFLVPSLRSITEDIIVLRFISRIPHQEREAAIVSIMRSNVSERIKTQSDFFGTFRPFQPVLNTGSLDEFHQDGSIAFWQNNGWPNLNGRKMPPIREIAKKCGEGTLDIIYDYLFRFTSATVHFSPQTLLRLGWGDSASKERVTFSPDNMSQYFSDANLIYGSCLFSLYFEMFGRFLRPNREEKQIVSKLRKRILEVFRWPEMVTFEEMNRPVQKVGIPHWIIKVVYSEIMEEGFLSGTSKFREIMTRYSGYRVGDDKVRDS